MPNKGIVLEETVLPFEMEQTKIVMTSLPSNFEMEKGDPPPWCPPVGKTIELGTTSLSGSDLHFTVIEMRKDCREHCPQAAAEGPDH